ncbi:RIOX2 [Symbiodinium necroappetens]|uniref:Bifunctional lysine-specific demethylase and histidyl-hydroxylase n=1 Tax=Symbiodinium necroappetens TaxID=1628268 RepID=A0A812LJH2_9DINO|nr:RIOX2 [Symbiodinium necroappetens]
MGWTPWGQPSWGNLLSNPEKDGLLKICIPDGELFLGAALPGSTVGSARDLRRGDTILKVNMAEDRSVLKRNGIKVPSLASTKQVSASSAMRRYLASPWVEANLRHLPKGGRALDIGCGKGRHSLLLLDLGFEVTALDCDAAVLAELKRRVPPEQLPRLSTCAEDVEVQASLAALLGPPFAVVLVVNYFCRPLLPQILELVAPDGILIFEAWAEGNQQFAKPKSAQVVEQRLLRANELLQLALPKFTVLAYADGLQEDYEGRDCAKQMICARRQQSKAVGKGGESGCYSSMLDDPLASFLRPGASKATLLEEPDFGLRHRLARGALPWLDFDVEKLLSSLQDFDPKAARSSQLARMEQRLQHGEQEAAPPGSLPPFSVTAVRRRAHGQQLTTETLDKDADIQHLLKSTALRTEQDVLERGAGWTLVVNHLQCTSPQLQALHQQMFALTGLSGGMNAYLTPPGAIGKPPHVDDHDVLVFQVAGEKKWMLLDANRELREEVVLHAGDVLYLPQGIPHHAAALEGTSPSLHLALGLHRLPLSTAFVLAAMLTARAGKAAHRVEASGLRLPASFVEEMESRGQAFAAFGTREHWLHQLLPQHLRLVEALHPDDLAQEQSLLAGMAANLRARGRELAELIRAASPCPDPRKALLRAGAAGSDAELLEVAQLPKEEFIDLALDAFWARREHVLDQHFAQHGPLWAEKAMDGTESQPWRKRPVAALQRRGGALRINGFRLALEGAELEAARLFLKATTSRGLRAEDLPESLRSVGSELLHRLLACGALEPADCHA